jgi:UDP-N-acetylmuramate dehydrogenase
MTKKNNRPYEATINEIIKKINIQGTLRVNEPMSKHTTLRIGGYADIYAAPVNDEDLCQLLTLSREFTIPIFILGEGSNILVSDRGIPGMVIHTVNLCRIDMQDNLLIAEGGAPITECSRLAANNNLSGLEFIYGMPGTAAGAVVMNARCYGSSISDILYSVHYIDNKGNTCRMENFSSFGYKKSPFQGKSFFITRVIFSLDRGKKNDLWLTMESHKKDRENKGHYRFLSAGSAFKNNRQFGEPTGKIIDRLGLRGYKIGDAKISDIHGNIIVNADQATASDTRKLLEFIEKEVRVRTGLALEREIKLVGDWD